MTDSTMIDQSMVDILTLPDILFHVFMHMGIHALDASYRHTPHSVYTNGSFSTNEINPAYGKATFRDNLDQTVNWYYVTKKGETQDSYQMGFQPASHGLCQWYAYIFYKADHNSKPALNLINSFKGDDEHGNNMKIIEYVFKSKTHELKTLVKDMGLVENIINWYNHGKSDIFKLTLETFKEIYDEFEYIHRGTNELDITTEDLTITKKELLFALLKAN